MDYFLNEYNRMMRKLTKPYQFRKKGQSYYRLINDVVQRIVMERLGGGHECRISFGVIPLCIDVKRNYGFTCIYYLRSFSEVYSREDSWFFNKEDERSVAECVDRISIAMRNVMFPFFDRADSCEKALSEAIALEKNSAEGVRYLDERKYFMAIKNKDYDFALKTRVAIKKQNLDAYNSALENGNYEQYWYDQVKNDIQMLDADIKRLEEKDEAYYKKVIEENEIKSIEYYENLFSPKKKSE